MAEPAVAKLIEPLIEMVVEVPSGVLHTISFTLALMLVVIFHVVLGEMVPKNIAIAQPERTAKILTPALRIYGSGVAACGLVSQCRVDRHCPDAGHGTSRRN